MGKKKNIKKKKLRHKWDEERDKLGWTGIGRREINARSKKNRTARRGKIINEKGKEEEEAEKWRMQDMEDKTNKKIRKG